MKKIILAAVATLALLFGFAGCSGDLHDASFINLDGYGIHGTPDGWKDGSEIPLENNGDGTYSATWTAVCGGSNSDASGETFAIRKINDTGWSTAYRLKQPKSQGDSANVFDSTNGMTQDVYLGQSADCMVIADSVVSAGDTVKLTVTPGTTSLSVKVEITKNSGGSGVVPYTLDGMYLVGGVFKTTGNDNAYNFTTENLIWGAETDVQTGNVTYTKNITAIAESGEMAINDSTWNNETKWGGADVTVKADGVAVALTQSKDNFKVSGLTVDSPYKVTITTTPDKTVSVAITEIVKYTLTFEVTGLSEGNAAYINGTFWGSGWPNGWPISSWNSPATKTFAVADENGVATFDSTWNVTDIAEPGADLTFNFKAIACSDSNWADADILNPSSDETVTISNIEAATYKISIDATKASAGGDAGVTVTKQ